MSVSLRLLRGWVGMVGFMAIGNTVSCYFNHSFLADRLYTGAPGQVNGLMARLFGVWTLLAAVLRIYCAVDIKNIPLYNLTFISFLLALVHFMSELFLYHTATFTIGIMAPLIISGISVVFMLYGYYLIHSDQQSKQHSS